VSREGALVTVYPPLEEDRLLRLFSSTIDTALSVNLNDLKGMVYDSFVSVGFRREALSSESVQILASMTKDLLVEIGQHKEIVAKSLEQASSKLVSKLANGLVQDHAFYSLFAPKMLVLAPSSPEEYLAVKRAVLRGMWGYVRRPNAEPLADLAGQELESSVYLNAIKRKLIMEEERNKVKLGELFSEGDIDAETRRKLWLLYNEVFTPGHQGSLSHLLANCGYGARLTRLESTRAWLAAIVSSIPVLLELATELVEAIAKRGRRDILRAKVSEDYVKETLLPGVVSM
ncbi:MAG: hypothetical protein N3D79_06500, partial [Acidilobaceae archaeon]|nr:hypothetical protein [Acidilobaceae archaeon]